MTFEEEFLTPILNHYFTADISTLNPTFETRERITTIGNMQIIIYSNDHNPPHFHVKSKDNRVNAKFQIKNGDFISGDITSKEMKRVKLFFSDFKTKMIMKRIWNKRLD